MSKRVAPGLWDAVQLRDGYRCIACGARPVTPQHRQSVGMGGTSRRPEEFGVYEIIALCGPCNSGVEASMQTVAKACGWKVEKWVSPAALQSIPVFDAVDQWWYKLTASGLRMPITFGMAALLMEQMYGEGRWRTWMRATRS